MKKLKYSYDAFEPVISKETMKEHYEVLYKGYVNNCNKALEKLEQARNTQNYDQIKCMEKELSFQGAGAILHEYFFENIAPFQTKIHVSMLEKIHQDFGNEKNFKDQFINNASNIEGSGWGILGYSNKLDKLIILQCEKHQDLTIWDFIPLLVIDVWEHAYYLDYMAKKKDYLENIFKMINWEVVSMRYIEIKK